MIVLLLWNKKPLMGTNAAESRAENGSRQSAPHHNKLINHKSN